MIRKKKRIMNFEIENALNDCGYLNIAGADEAGAGSLIGPVVAAAVIMNERCFNENIRDSKLLTADQRNDMYEFITKNCIAWSVGVNSVERIDKINILWARLEAMKIAIENLKIIPDYILVDGNKDVPDITIPQRAIIKGDGKAISIAAASIIAKVTRDRMMAEIGNDNLEYDLASNKGYYCKKVINQIKKEGYRKNFHRRKFVEKFVKES